jgi:hypothetical protein
MIEIRIRRKESVNHVRLDWITPPSSGMLAMKSELIAPAIIEPITSIKKTLTLTPPMPKMKKITDARVVVDDLVVVRTLMGLETKRSSLVGSLYEGPVYSGKGVGAGCGV